MPHCVISLDILTFMVNGVKAFDIPGAARPMPALKTRSHEQVCQAYASASISQVQAVRSANLHPGSAPRIFARPDVKARIAELRGQRQLMFPVDGAISKGLLVTEILNNIRAAREGGNFAAANVALRALLVMGGVQPEVEIVAQPFGSSLTTMNRRKREATKEQQALKNRTDCDQDMREEDDGSSADDRATPDISEIADMAGGFDNGPGDLVEEEQIEPALGEAESGVPEVDGDERPGPTAASTQEVRRDEAGGVPQATAGSST